MFKLKAVYLSKPYVDLLKDEYFKQIGKALPSSIANREPLDKGAVPFLPFYIALEDGKDTGALHGLFRLRDENGKAKVLFILENETYLDPELRLLIDLNLKWIEESLLNQCTGQDWICNQLPTYKTEGDI